MDDGGSNIMDFDWLAPIVPLSDNLNFYGSAGILVLTLVLVAICWYGCQVYHSLMADTENSQHILLNIAYQHYAINLQGTAIVNAAKEISWFKCL